MLNLEVLLTMALAKVIVISVQAHRACGATAVTKADYYLLCLLAQTYVQRGILGRHRNHGSSTRVRSTKWAVFTGSAKDDQLLCLNASRI